MREAHANPEDLDLYALGALDGEEKQTLEAHLRTCPACAQKLAAARQRSALMEKGKAERRAPVVEIKSKKKRWGLRFSFGFGLATAVLAFATFEFAKQDFERGKQIKHLEAQLSQDSAAMQAMGEVTGAPDSAQITLFEQPGGPPGQAHVVYNARLGVGVYSGQIAPAPAGKSYQLWLVPASGVPANAGLVEANQENGAVVVRLAPGLVAKAFAVTLEPQGGMPQPTGPKVLVGAAS